MRGLLWLPSHPELSQGSSEHGSEKVGVRGRGEGAKQARRKENGDKNLPFFGNLLASPRDCNSLNCNPWVTQLLHHITVDCSRRSSKKMEECVSGTLKTGGYTHTHMPTCPLPSTHSTHTHVSIGRSARPMSPLLRSNNPRFHSRA